MKPTHSAVTRRDALKASIASVGFSALALEPAQAAVPRAPDERRGVSKHYPEALILQTSDSLDRILGRKA